MYTKTTLILLFLLFSFALTAQEIIEPKISMESLGDTSYIFEATGLPVLRKAPGLPKNVNPGYKFMWLFGDGHYSTDSVAVHSYEQGGQKKVWLFLTVAYADYDSIGIASRIINVSRGTGVAPGSNYNYSSALEARRNHNPVPEEKFLLWLGYKNGTERAQKGKIVLFYNEEKVPFKSFSPDEPLMNFGERWENKASQYTDQLLAPVDPLNNILSKPRPDEAFRKKLDLSAGRYQDMMIFEFEELQPDEVRNIFLPFTPDGQTAELIKKPVPIEFFFLPDDGVDRVAGNIQLKIEKSHDPNKIAVSRKRFSYRTYICKYGDEDGDPEKTARVKEKKEKQSRETSARERDPKRDKRNYRGKNRNNLENQEEENCKDKDFRIRYTTYFQNNGTGAAKEIKIRLSPLPESLDRESFTYIENSLCQECLEHYFEEDSLFLHFTGISLPGSKQENFKKKNSKGRVAFSFDLKNNLVNKQSTKFRAYIFFDDNEEIVTNAAKTRFKTGLSPEFKAGYDLAANSSKFEDNFFLGAAVTPYRPGSVYPQAEILYYPSISYKIDDTAGIVSNSTRSTSSIRLSGQARYDLSRSFGIGTGLEFGFHSIKTIEESITAKESPKSTALFLDLKYGQKRGNWMLGGRVYRYWQNMEVDGNKTDTYFQVYLGLKLFNK